MKHVHFTALALSLVAFLLVMTGLDHARIAKTESDLAKLDNFTRRQIAGLHKIGSVTDSRVDELNKFAHIKYEGQFDSSGVPYALFSLETPIDESGIYLHAFRYEVVAYHKKLDTLRVKMHCVRETLAKGEDAKTIYASKRFTITTGALP